MTRYEILRWQLAFRFVVAYDNVFMTVVPAFFFRSTDVVNQDPRTHTQQR